MSISFIYQRSAFYLEPETSPPISHWKNCSLWYCYIVLTLQIQRIWPSLYTVYYVLSRKLDWIFLAVAIRKEPTFYYLNQSIIFYIIFLSHGQTPVQCWTAVGDGSPCSALQPCLVTKQWQQLSSCFRFWFEWTSSSQRISKEQGLLFPAAVQDGGHKMGLETAELHWMWKSEWCSCARQVADSWGTEFQNKNNGIVHQSFIRHNR